MESITELPTFTLPMKNSQTKTGLKKQESKAVVILSYKKSYF